MSEATVCVSFHTFCERFSGELYEDNFHLPEGAAHQDAMDHYHKIGFTGAIGSNDVIYVK